MDFPQRVWRMSWRTLPTTRLRDSFLVVGARMLVLVAWSVVVLVTLLVVALVISLF